MPGEQSIAKNNSYVRVLLQIIDSLLYSPRQESVIGIEPGENVTLRAFPSLIDVGRLAPIRMTVDRDTVRIFGEYLRRLIRRAVIDHLIFNSRVVLRKHTLQRFSKKGGLIVSGSDY